MQEIQDNEQFCVRNSQKSMTGAMSKQTHQVGLIIQFASHKDTEGKDNRPM